MNPILTSNQLPKFPKESKIARYLERHHLTNGSYLKDEKIIEAVAKRFANKSENSTTIDISVRATMDFLNSARLEQCPNGLRAIKINLTLALIDCANRQQIRT